MNAATGNVSAAEQLRALDDATLLPDLDGEGLECEVLIADFDTLDPESEAGAGQAAALGEDAGVDVLVTGIGGGKSHVAGFKVVRWAIDHPRRRDGTATEWLVLGEDVRNVYHAQLLAKVVPILEALEKRWGVKLIKKKVGKPEPHIELTTGVKIWGFSGNDPDSLRNFEFDGMWMDEAAVQAEEAFAVGLSRQRSADKLRAIVTSSPKPGWLWRIVKAVTQPEATDEPVGYAKLLEASRVTVHRWSSRENPYNKSEVLDGIDGALEAVGAEFAQQETGGLFVGVETDREIFPGYHEQLGSLDVDLTAAQCSPLTMGVDLGQNVDYTWLTVMGRTGVVLHMERFNGSTPGWTRKRFYVQVKERVVELAREWGITDIRLDTAMHGKSFGQELDDYRPARAIGLKVNGERTNAPLRRDQMIEALSQACAHRRFRVPETWVGPDGRTHRVKHVAQLRKEIEEIEAPTVNGKRRWKHPPGGHDDGIVSCALALIGVDEAPTPMPNPATTLAAFAAAQPTNIPRYG